MGNNGRDSGNVARGAWHRRDADGARLAGAPRGTNVQGARSISPFIIYGRQMAYAARQYSRRDGVYATYRPDIWQRIFRTLGVQTLGAARTMTKRECESSIKPPTPFFSRLPEKDSTDETASRLRYPACVKAYLFSKKGKRLSLIIFNPARSGEPVSSCIPIFRRLGYLWEIKY